MRPGGIEVHIKRQRTREPDSESRKERISLGEIFAGKPKGEPQSEKTIERRAQRHGDNVRLGESVRRNMAAEGIIGKNEEMGGEQKRRPENRGADREMIVHVAGGRELLGEKIARRICSSHAKSRIGPEPVLLEIEIVLDEQRPAEGVVSDPVAADPWIDEREREYEKKRQNFVVAREPSQSGSSSNESQFFSRLESPRDCDWPTRRLSY